MNLTTNNAVKILTNTETVTSITSFSDIIPTLLSLLARCLLKCVAFLGRSD